MGDFGFKIAKEGADVESENPADYIFWSKYPSRTILSAGKISHTRVTSFDSIVIPHNLGYIPQVALYTTTHAGVFMRIPFELSGESVITVNMDTTNITFGFSSSFVGFTYTIYYIIFMDPVVE